jgi:hypothetical protein
VVRPHPIPCSSRKTIRASTVADLEYPNIATETRIREMIRIPLFFRLSRLLPANTLIIIAVMVNIVTTSPAISDEKPSDKVYLGSVGVSI